MTGFVKIFYEKVKNEGWTIEQVPALWRAKVQAELDKQAEETNNTDNPLD